MKYKNIFIQFAVVLVLNLNWLFAVSGFSNDGNNFFVIKKVEHGITSVDAPGVELCMPVEVLNVCEDEYGYILITTFENSFVKAPINIVINLVFRDGMRGVRFNLFGYECYAMGFDVLSVNNGSKVMAGQIVGSLLTDTLYMKVYKNENRVSLKTLRAIFNV